MMSDQCGCATDHVESDRLCHRGSTRGTLTPPRNLDINHPWLIGGKKRHVKKLNPKVHVNRKANGERSRQRGNTEYSVKKECDGPNWRAQGS